MNEYQKEKIKELGAAIGADSDQVTKDIEENGQQMINIANLIGSIFNDGYNQGLYKKGQAEDEEKKEQAQAEEDLAEDIAQAEENLAEDIAQNYIK